MESFFTDDWLGDSTLETTTTGTFNDPGGISPGANLDGDKGDTASELLKVIGYNSVLQFKVCASDKSTVLKLLA
jgi:hypothetical protein